MRADWVLLIIVTQVLLMTHTEGHCMTKVQLPMIAYWGGMAYRYPGYWQYYTPSGCRNPCHPERNQCPPAGGDCCWEGNLYPDGSTWKDGKCKNCECASGKINCVDHCCYSNGTVHEDGSQWKEDECKTCTCCQGNIDCKQVCCNVNGYTYKNKQQFSFKRCRSCVEETALNCTCLQGGVNCIDTCFSCCRSWGEPHYLTLDGQYFPFQGSCRYIHAMDCDDSIFRIEVQNEYIPSRRWARVTDAFIYLKYGRRDVCGRLQNGREERIVLLRLDNGFAVKVNGAITAVPYSVSSPALSYTIDVGVAEDGYPAVFVKSTSHNIKVLWSSAKYWIRIYIGYSHLNRVCGLCGNFDLDARNDIGINGIPTDPNTFGDHWKARGAQLSTCVPVTTIGASRQAPRRVKRNVPTSEGEVVPFPCNIKRDPEVLYLQAQKKCRKLKNAPVCCGCGVSSHANPDVYFNSCVYDYCACDNRQDCLQNSVANFESLCSTIFPGINATGNLSTTMTSTTMTSTTTTSTSPTEATSNTTYTESPLTTTYPSTTPPDTTYPSMTPPATTYPPTTPSATTYPPTNPPATTYPPTTPPDTTYPPTTPPATTYPPTTHPDTTYSSTTPPDTTYPSTTPPDTTYPPRTPPAITYPPSPPPAITYPPRTPPAITYPPRTPPAITFPPSPPPAITFPPRTPPPSTYPELTSATTPRVSNETTSHAGGNATAGVKGCHCEIPKIKKVYGRCELAKILKNVDFMKNKVADWVCLAFSESSYRAAVIGGPNGKDGSCDYGLFQINSYYWCSPPAGKGNECKMSCCDLLDNKIEDDIKCVKKIYKRHGFKAWVGWTQKCKGKNLLKYIKGCF